MNVTKHIDDQILECLNEIHRLRKMAWKQAPCITELKNKIEKLKLDRENFLAQYRAGCSRYYGK